jgi:4-hydroxyphenylpyruvate dioxygenase
MPDRISVEGFEFVEFAADESEAQELARLLIAMGFTEAARHKNKDVTLFRQGGINIVINTEKEGLAHSSYIAHGTSAYAIGLRVEDASATVIRARALGAEIFEQRPGPGELAIPAIRGIGGGVIYFIDGKTELARVWQIEFDPVGGSGGSGAGLTHLDHVAQTMNYEEMLTWLLFYLSIFDTRKAPMVDVIDPGGLVRSQAIENAEGSLRLTLNGAENHKTLAGHFISERFGASIQHLAFATGDIMATVNALTERGFQPLPISPNYYDDLETRFDLAPEALDFLRKQNILYDRDAHGEFYQIYSRTYGEGFFFEIVERRGEYKGYGAANAPFRIAAQKREIRPAGIPRR